jgi:hypothetical protein
MESGCKISLKPESLRSLFADIPKILIHYFAYLFPHYEDAQMIVNYSSHKLVQRLLCTYSET